MIYHLFQQKSRHFQLIFNVSSSLTLLKDRNWSSEMKEETWCLCLFLTQSVPEQERPTR